MVNKRCMILGGAGSIGSEIVRQLVEHNEILVIDINETALFDLVEELKLKGGNILGRIGDIREPEVLEEMVSDWGLPDVIFHAAALKHVTPQEWYPVEAVKTNIIGTLNVLRFAKNHDIGSLIYISTDKVVNGESIMGLTKKIGEKAVKNAGYVSVRFGNVLGSRGSVIPFWQGQMDRGEALTVTDKRMTRFFMTIPEAVKLVIKAAEIGKPGQILVLDMGETKNVYDLACEILKKSGKEDLGIKIIGMRPGETLDERIMTESEAKSAKKLDNLWVL